MLVLAVIGLGILIILYREARKKPALPITQELPEAVA
jgi:hypothetical protein